MKKAATETMYRLLMSTVMMALAYAFMWWMGMLPAQQAMHMAGGSDVGGDGGSGGQEGAGRTEL